MTVTAQETVHAATWPQLPWRDWADTIATVHMWTQIGTDRLTRARQAGCLRTCAVS
jgi:hypothetical protein